MVLFKSQHQYNREKEMVCASSFDRHNMLYNMQGPFFAAIAKALKIKPCRKSCRVSLINRHFTSIADVVARLSSGLSQPVQDIVRDRFLLCLHFHQQDIFTSWLECLAHFQRGMWSYELQDLYEEWLEKNHPRATTLRRAVVLVLHAKLAITSEQAAYCFEPLPQTVTAEIVHLLYRLLLRICDKVCVSLDQVPGQKVLLVKYLKETSPPVLFYT